MESYGLFFSLVVFKDINVGPFILLYVFIILATITMVRDKLKKLFTLKISSLLYRKTNSYEFKELGML